MRQILSRFDRLLIWLLVVFSLAIGVGAYLYYINQKRVIQIAAGEQLAVIADLKVADLTRWREERQNDGDLILHSPMVSQLVTQFLQNPADDAHREAMVGMLRHWKKYNHYNRAVLLDSNLVPRLGAEPSENWIGPVATAATKMARFSTESCLLSDLHIGSRSGRPNLDVLVPVWDRSRGDEDTNQFAGVLMFEVDAADYLYPQIQRWPTPSKTAETLLIRREGDDLVYLNELRHKTNTALRLRIPIRSFPSLPAVQAVLGAAGIIKGTDYRGVPVIAAIGPVPNTSWFIVSKQDISEINAPLREKAGWVFTFAALLVIAASLATGLLWRTREVHFNARQLEEKAQSEAAVKYSYSLLGATLESTPAGVLAVDMTGRVTNLNENCVRLWRLSLELAAARDAQKLEDWAASQVKDPAGFKAKIIEMASQPDAESFDILETIDGRSLERYSLPQRLDGRTVGRVWSFRDITERKRSEDQRESLTRRLQQKNQELEELIYAASHDLRSPLVNIEGFSRRLEAACREIKVLVEAPGADAKARERLTELLTQGIPKSLRYIQNGAGKMNSLISGLLHLARLGQVYIHPELLEMKALLELILNTMAFQIQKTGAVVELGPLPPCVGDAALINQVFSNLIDNAIKYRDPQRPLIIRISGKTEKDRVIYCVADTGKGIPGDSLGKIWELFRRLDPDGSEPGEGLGLKLVRRIVDRHDGRVWVESVFGEGTRFYVSLPAWLNTN